MSQLFDENESVQPVTLVQAGPCFVTQVKDDKKDGYHSVQVGFWQTSKDKDSKKGKEKSKIKSYRYIREFRVQTKDDKKDIFSVGDKIDVSLFSVKDKVQVRGITKGKGFQGVVKRHGFRGGPASHGHRHVLRSGGSIGSRFPQHSKKGLRMAGRMGAMHATMKSIEILWIDPKEHLMALRGSIPGPKNSLVEIVTL